MISICPLCDAKIRLPEGYGPDTLCSCPECHGEFRVAQILQMDAPEAHPVVVEDASVDVEARDVDLDEFAIEADEFLDAEFTEQDSTLIQDPTDVHEIPVDASAEDVHSPFHTSELDERLDTEEDDHDLQELLRDVDERATDDELDELFAGSDQLDQEVEADALFSQALSESPSSEQMPEADFEIEELKGALSEEDDAFALIDQGEALTDAEVDVAEEPTDQTEKSEPAIKPVPVFQFRPAGNGEGGPTAGRRRDRKKNPLVEIVKVVLGGVAGLAIAQLILWWLPEGWRRDPVELAPKLPDALAFLAPNDLRNPNGVALLTDGPGSSTQEDADRATTDGTGIDTSDETTGSTSVDDNDLSDSFQQAQNNARQATPSGDDWNSDLEVVPDQDARDSGDNGSPTGAQSENLNVGPVDTRPYSATELATALMDARSATDNLQQLLGDREHSDALRNAANQFSDAMSRFAEALSPAPAEDSDGTVKLAKDFMRELAASKVMTQVLAAAAESRLRAGAEGGLIVPGRVVGTNAVGSLREIQVEIIRPSRPTIMVVTVANGGPSDAPLQAGDQILVSGRIVDTPLTSLPGYEGQADRVLWTRHAVPISAAEPAGDA